jgi:nucleotide-binding universal stress UspA family protein
MLKILVPTDFSPEAKNACLYAYEFARYTNSTLLLYHAIPLPIAVTDIPFENFYLDEQQEIDLLHDSFERLMLQHQLDPKMVEVKACISSNNNVSTGIQEAYKKHQCDMVIMGTHGASGISSVILGSNTASLIAQSRIPIIAVPYNYKFQPIYHLVYSSDLENLEEELSVIVPFAKVFQAVLEVFYFDYAGPDSEKLMLNAEQYINSLAYKNISLLVQKGNIHLSVAENLKRQLNPANTQMLILYRSEHSWLDNLMMGSNTRKLVMEPSIPMFVLPKNPVFEG